MIIKNLSVETTGNEIINSIKLNNLDIQELLNDASAKHLNFKLFTKEKHNTTHAIIEVSPKLPKLINFNKKFYIG
jgi:hypothetical protein